MLLSNLPPYYFFFCRNTAIYLNQIFFLLLEEHSVLWKDASTKKIEWNLRPKYLILENYPQEVQYSSTWIYLLLVWEKLHMDLFYSLDGWYTLLDYIFYCYYTIFTDIIVFIFLISVFVFSIRIIFFVAFSTCECIFQK